MTDTATILLRRECAIEFTTRAGLAQFLRHYRAEKHSDSFAVATPTILIIPSKNFEWAEKYLTGENIGFTLKQVIPLHEASRGEAVERLAKHLGHGFKERLITR